jgi:hypothetical protein
MRLVILMLLVSLAACSDKPEDVAREVLKKADVDVEGFKSVDGKTYDAQACEAGAHEELDITACAFADATSAGIQSEKMEDALAGDDDALTVVVKQKGSVLVGIVDRKKVDPNGKKIAELLKKLDD